MSCSRHQNDAIVWWKAILSVVGKGKSSLLNQSEFSKQVTPFWGEKEKIREKFCGSSYKNAKELDGFFGPSAPLSDHSPQNIVLQSYSPTVPSSPPLLPGLRRLTSPSQSAPCFKKRPKQLFTFIGKDAS